MKRNFTIDDLILYHYNELPEEDKASLEMHMLFNDYLKEANDSILQVKKLLNTEKTSPSDMSIRLIMDHNRKSRGELETI